MEGLVNPRQGLVLLPHLCGSVSSAMLHMLQTAVSLSVASVPSCLKTAIPLYTGDAYTRAFTYITYGAVSRRTYPKAYSTPYLITSHAVSHMLGYSIAEKLTTRWLEQACSLKIKKLTESNSLYYYL